MPVRILVVDDEPDLEVLIRQRFRKKIREAEFEFLFAGDGVEALDTLRSNGGIDIVLTDINMPRMDGLTLLAELAKLDTMLKSVVISAYGDMRNIRTAMNRGAFDFLTKPIDFRDLEITIEKTIRELNVLREGARARTSLIAVEQELEVAAHIQSSILPKVFPPFPDLPEIDVYATMKPARSVGGDFYDFFFIEEARLAFVIGDVAGKGVPAALFMAVTRTLLRATAHAAASPEACLRQINSLLCIDNVSELFVTVVYGVLDTRSGEVSYSNAGHNPPYHMTRDGGPRLLENLGGLVLGVLEDAEYRSARLTLAPGEGMFLYTDGLTESMNAEGLMFGEGRVAEHLNQGRAAPLEDLTRGVVSAAENFAGGRAQHDDITTLAIRYNGCPPE